MHHTTVTIVGAGQAGLAMSHCLSARSIDHVLLERGRVANSWHTERWDSLRLLTPNWLSRLPGWRYRGDDPDGYMTAAQVAAHLDGYRRHLDAPVREHTTVRSVRSGPADDFVVTTDGDRWRSRAVVIASGASSDPHRPALHSRLPATMTQLTSVGYRNPGQAGDAVLVVGASASGVQIADELARQGRRVVLAVGDHVRLPRTYRGRDIHWWLDAIGQLDEGLGDVEDLDRARRLPSLQLVGSPDRRNLDLATLAARGVELVGRLVGVTADALQFSGGLAHLCRAADLKLGRLLDRIDLHCGERGLAVVAAPDRPEPVRLGTVRTVIGIGAFDTVVWATGFRPHYPWLDEHHLDRKGGLRHDGGVLEQPGLYVLGLPFTRRRKSSFLDGVGPDAVELTEHLAGHLDTGRRSRSPGTRVGPSGRPDQTGVSSAAPKDTLNRSHQMLTLVRPSMSVPAGTG
ncbi:NAD(P)-binding domain-containing protein [Mycobacterium sp. Y57]|uniref:NAD(P)-binding domain-containing protein n=1 Tax=Mycolicibacterium xanthum TaxID=2796469 RepID=UPI001C8457AB|nr:NAD(P)-binding domain-containing protein [Mycolicibacterium xanthum]MBX7435103.1 NAD(P)-binding domain-containing protein [Mycolicibacterium xanthum]